ncbi:FAD-dependent oxidoreductase, partial [Candidatus Pacearchaeota archaeon]|nr:FAD-dependent oxidoreductase [Candidatus Pacearchaeota archaeon]
GEEKNAGLVKEIEDIFSIYNVKVKEAEQKEIESMRKKAIRYGINAVYARQTHVGSDKLGELMKKIRDDLKEKGIKFETQKFIKNLDEIDFDYAILAPGRGKASWLEELLVKNSIPFSYRPVDIGVRIEVPKEITEDVIKITRDLKFYILTEKYRDKVRTFCTCPEGFVAKEAHENFVLVNGYANAEKKTENTNFALLVTIPLTEPLVNTNIFANLLAQVFKGLGDGKPILQRLGDLKQGRRSKIKDQDKYAFKPTLKDVTYGDITLAMPGRYLDDIIESIEKLDKIMPGLANNSTLLYAPEIKFHGLEIKTNKYLQASDKIYVAGDGAGLSRGIVGAAASGMLAAEGILERLKID